MIILRVQHKTSLDGPYSQGAAANAVLESHMIRSVNPPKDWHPGPYTDFGEKWYDLLPCQSWCIRFGFKNLTQLKAWFPEPCLKDLFSVGFEIARYRVPTGHFVLGQKQVMFNWSEATRWTSSRTSPSSPMSEYSPSASAAVSF